MDLEPRFLKNETRPGSRPRQGRERGGASSGSCAALTLPRSVVPRTATLRGLRTHLPGFAWDRQGRAASLADADVYIASPDGKDNRAGQAHRAARNEIAGDLWLAIVHIAGVGVFHT